MECSAGNSAPIPEAQQGIFLLPSYWRGVFTRLILPRNVPAAAESLAALSRIGNPRIPRGKAEALVLVTKDPSDHPSSDSGKRREPKYMQYITSQISPLLVIVTHSRNIAYVNDTIRRRRFRDGGKSRGL